MLAPNPKLDFQLSVVSTASHRIFEIVLLSTAGILLKRTKSDKGSDVTEALVEYRGVERDRAMPMNAYSVLASKARAAVT